MEGGEGCLVLCVMDSKMLLFIIGMNQKSLFILDIKCGSHISPVCFHILHMICDFGITSENEW